MMWNAKAGTNSATGRESFDAGWFVRGTEFFISVFLTTHQEARQKTAILIGMALPLQVSLRAFALRIWPVSLEPYQTTVPLRAGW
jgi:hypothetical protein